MKSMKRNQKNPRVSGKSCCYKFTLLYRYSRDRSNFKNFRNMCANKGPTVTVGKVLNTEEILGGYNPISWSANVPYKACIQTSESFIFSLNKDKLDESIVSFISENDGWGAVYEYEHGYPHFGNGPDLTFGGCIGVVQSPYSKSLSYQIAIRSTGNFELVDWEVFSIMKMNKFV